MKLKGKQIKRYSIGVLLIALVSLICLFNKTDIYAETTQADHGQSIYHRRGVQVYAKPVEGGVDVYIDNQTTDELADIELGQPELKPLVINNSVNKLERIQSNQGAVLSVRYAYPGAQDQNPNTSNHSFRILPRTGVSIFGLIISSVLLIVALGLWMIRRRLHRSSRMMSLCLLVAVAILASSLGLFKGRVIYAAAETSAVKVPIQTEFKLGQTTYTYHADLKFVQKSVTTVIESEIVSIDQTEYELDATLPVVDESGQSYEKIVKSGVPGDIKQTIEVTYVNGTVVKKNIVKKETLKDAQPTVIALGAKPVTTQVEQPYSTLYEADYTRLLGEPNQVKRAGQPGIIATTYRRNPKTHKVESTEQKTEPIHEVIRVAAKETVNLKVPSETVWKPDLTANVGQTSIQTNGQDGMSVKTILHEVDQKTGELIRSKDGETKVTQSPVQTIKLGGVLYQVRSTIPYEVTEEPSDELYVGQTNVIVKGINGESIKTYVGTIDSRTGEVKQNPETDLLQDNQIVDPVTEVVLKGTKEPKRIEKTITETLPFVTHYEPSEAIPYGTQKVKSAGVKGRRTTTYSIAVNEQGAPLPESKFPKQVVETTMDAPVDAVIQVGHRKVITESYQAEPAIKENKMLRQGALKTVSDGQPGERERIQFISVNPKTGALGAPLRTVQKVLTPAVPAVIEKGTKGEILTESESKIVAALNKAFEDRFGSTKTSKSAASKAHASALEKTEKTLHYVIDQVGSEASRDKAFELHQAYQQQADDERTFERSILLKDQVVVLQWLIDNPQDLSKESIDETIKQFMPKWLKSKALQSTLQSKDEQTVRLGVYFEDHQCVIYVEIIPTQTLGE